MMNSREATGIVRKNLPSGKIQSFVEYKNLFIFQVFLDLPGEEGLDPFFSVDRDTGEFRDFSIITDGDPKVIDDLFVEANSRRSK